MGAIYAGCLRSLATERARGMRFREAGERNGFEARPRRHRGSAAVPTARRHRAFGARPW